MKYIYDLYNVIIIMFPNQLHVFMTRTILKCPRLFKGFLLRQTLKLNGILDGCSFKNNWCQSRKLLEFESTFEKDFNF